MPPTAAMVTVRIDESGDGADLRRRRPAGPVRHGHGGQLRPNPELLQDAPDLRADRRQGYEVLLGDLFGRQTVDEGREHALLTRRHLLERRARAVKTRPLRPQLVQQRFTGRLADQWPSGEDVLDRGDNVVEEGVLADPAVGAGLDAGGQGEPVGLGGSA